MLNLHGRVNRSTRLVPARWSRFITPYAPLKTELRYGDRRRREYCRHTANIAYDKAGALSKEGKCKTFSDRADGFAVSEGAGILF